MTLDKKLQLKAGQTVAVLYAHDEPEIAAVRARFEKADAVLVYVLNQADLKAHLEQLKYPAQQGKLTWLAYPKAKQLGTDLNRDIIRETLQSFGLDPVRQIALDDVWSGMRVKPLT